MDENGVSGGEGGGVAVGAGNKQTDKTLAPPTVEDITLLCMRLLCMS